MRQGKLPVRDIAKRMGVSVATLYRHVGKRGAGGDLEDDSSGHQPKATRPRALESPSG